VTAPHHRHRHQTTTTTTTTAPQEAQARLGAPQSPSPSGSGGGLIPRLLALLQPGCGDALACGLLGLLHSLSFDAELRGQMVAGGLVQQVGCWVLGVRCCCSSALVCGCRSRSMLSPCFL
jgi:hypothetical protein